MRQCWGLPSERPNFNRLTEIIRRIEIEEKQQELRWKSVFEVHRGDDGEDKQPDNIPPTATDKNQITSLQAEVPQDPTSYAGLSHGNVAAESPRYTEI